MKDRERERDRQTDRKMERETDRQTESGKERADKWKRLSVITISEFFIFSSEIGEKLFFSFTLTSTKFN